MYDYDEVIIHHGIKGQHWGVRKYQNEDGSLTSAGLKRYLDDGNGNYIKKSGATKRAERALNKAKTNNDWKDKNGKEITEVRDNKGNLLLSKGEVSAMKAQSNANVLKAQNKLDAAKAKDAKRDELHKQGKLTGGEKAAIAVGAAAVTAALATVAVKKLNQRNMNIEIAKGKTEIEHKVKEMNILADNAAKNGMSFSGKVSGHNIIKNRVNNANSMSFKDKVKNVYDNRGMDTSSAKTFEGLSDHVISFTRKK